MSGFSHVVLFGNVTRDPQLKQLPGDKIVAEFGLATNRKFRSATGEERVDTCFIDCAAWGKRGEVLAHYCRKGRPLFVQGRLKYDSWEDKQGGKHSKISVVIESFKFIGDRRE
jgi:single-strand DNA-binding protein